MFHVHTKVHVRIEWDGESMVLTCKCRESRRKVRSSCRHVLSSQSSQVKLSQVTIVSRLRTKTYQIILISVCTRWHETPNIKTINNNPKDEQIANRENYTNSKSS